MNIARRFKDMDESACEGESEGEGADEHDDSRPHPHLRSLSPNSQEKSDFNLS